MEVEITSQQAYNLLSSIEGLFWEGVGPPIDYPLYRKLREIAKIEFSSQMYHEIPEGESF